MGSFRRTRSTRLIRRSAVVLTPALLALMVSGCAATDAAVAPPPSDGTQIHTGWQLSVQNVANSRPFIQAFSVGYDVYYAGVTADLKGIQIIHQAPDFTLEPKSGITLKPDGSESVVPGSIQVSDQFTDPSGRIQVAITAVTNGTGDTLGDHAATWNVQYSPNDGSLSRTAFSDWVGPPIRGLSKIVSMTAFPTVVNQNGMFYPSRVAIRWQHYTKGDDRFYAYNWPKPGPPDGTLIFQNVDKVPHTPTIGSSRVEIPRATGGADKRLAFTFIDDEGMQVLWWDDQGNLSRIVSEQRVPVAAVLVAPFANVGDGRPDVAVITGSDKAFVAKFMTFAYDKDSSRPQLAPASITPNPITLKGITSAEDIAYGLMGYEPPSSLDSETRASASPPSPGHRYSTVPMILSSQADAEGNPGLAAVDLKGNALPAITFPRSLVADKRASVGSVVAGNFLGGFAALGGITPTGQLGLYGYSKQVGGFDLSTETSGATSVKWALPQADARHLGR